MSAIVRGRQFARVMALCSILGLLAGCTGGGSSAEEYVLQAKEHSSQGQVRAAVIELKNALRAEQDNREARWLLGRMYIELGDGASAAKELRRAVDLGVSEQAAVVPMMRAEYLQGNFEDVTEAPALPPNLSPSEGAEYWTLQGHANTALGLTDRARDDYGQALQYSEGFAEALSGMARLAMNNFEYEEARELLQQAIANDEEEALAWSLLGELELQLDNQQAAADAFSRAIELRPYVSLDMAKRALAYAGMGEFDKAHEDLNKLKKEGADQNAYYNYVLGVTHFKEKQYKSAAPALRTAVERAPKFVQAHAYLATTQFYLANYEQAMVYAEKSLALAPASLGLKRLLGVIHIERDEYAEAEQVLTEALENKPDDEVTLALLARLSLLQGDAGKGGEYSQRLAEISPETGAAKNLQLLSRIMKGEDFDLAVDADTQGAEPSHDEYSRRFLYALDAFRRGDLKLAIEQAQELHDEYPERIDPLNLIGACYLAAGQWDRARQQFEQVLEQEPHEPSATRNLAKLAIMDGRPEQARDLLSGLVEAAPRDEEAVLSLADLLRQLDDEKAALEVLERGIENAPGSGRLRLQLARTYLNQAQFAEVMRVTRDIDESLIREYPRLLEMRGRAQLLTQDIASAKHTFRRWMDLSPQSAEAHFMYGEVLARDGELDKARQEIARAIELRPDFLRARVAQIKALVFSREIVQAREELDRLRADFGDHPEVNGIEGWYSLITGDLETAEEKLASALENLNDSELTLYLVRAYWGQEKYEQAVDLMLRRLQEQPRDLAVLMHLAGSHLSLQQEEKARSVYQQIVEYYPNHVVALNNLAWLSRNRDLQYAIEIAERAREFAPDDPGVLNTVGALYLMHGESRRALDALARAADIRPGDMRIQLDLARALVKNDRPSEAEQALQRVLENASDPEVLAEARKLSADMDAAAP